MRGKSVAVAVGSCLHKRAVLCCLGRIPGRRLLAGRVDCTWVLERNRMMTVEGVESVGMDAAVANRYRNRSRHYCREAANGRVLLKVPVRRRLVDNRLAENSYQSIVVLGLEDERNQKNTGGLVEEGMAGAHWSMGTVVELDHILQVLNPQSRRWGQGDLLEKEGRNCQSHAVEEPHILLLLYPEILRWVQRMILEGKEDRNAERAHILGLPFLALVTWNRHTLSRFG
jgi:hypothetical protein